MKTEKSQSLRKSGRLFPLKVDVNTMRPLRRNPFVNQVVCFIVVATIETIPKSQSLRKSGRLFHILSII